MYFHAFYSDLHNNCTHIGAVVEVTVNSENFLSGIYFQDGHMREIYQKFPEILFVDVMHKLNELRIPLCFAGIRWKWRKPHCGCMGYN